MPLVKHVSGDFYCYAEDAGEAAWAYGPLHHSEIPATAADAMEILENQDRERMEEDGAWLYDEIVANRAFGVDYPAPNQRIDTLMELMYNALSEVTWIIDEYANDWNTDNPTDVTIALPKLHLAIQSYKNREK
jgi:hypothetical protein